MPLAEPDTRTSPSEDVGLLSLSVEPAPAAESVTLPPGNRQGAFIISPASSKAGLPGGAQNRVAKGKGNEGEGAAGDLSASLGPEDRDAGNGRAGRASESPRAGERDVGGAGSALTSPASNGNVSASGGENKDGGLPSFYASYGASVVYPVRPLGPHRPTMIVTAGPTGGGGLQAYGVLKGGKVYTIYLPMPGKNWILQYCAHFGSATSQGQEPRSVEIKLDPGVVPPSAMEQFDFHRPPVSEKAADQKVLIILQGVIWEDGSVGQLKVYKGLFEAVDQAALAAFSRWRFRPAQRLNQPIAVEVLVGIPVTLPAT